MKVCPRCGYSDDPTATAEVSAEKMRELVGVKEAHPSEPPTLPKVMITRAPDPFPARQNLPTDPSGLVARAARRTQAAQIIAFSGAVAAVVTVVAMFLLARC